MNESRYLGDHESVLETDPNPSVDEGFDEIDLELEGAEEASGYEEIDWEEAGKEIGSRAYDSLIDGGAAYSAASSLAKGGALVALGASVGPEAAGAGLAYLKVSTLWDSMEAGNSLVESLVGDEEEPESSYNNFEKRIAYDLPKATYEKAKDVGESAVEFSKNAYDFATGMAKGTYDSVLGDRE